MTLEQQAYYDNYLEMFMTAGWQQFVEDLSKSVEDLERTAVASLTDERGLYRLKGRLEALTQMGLFESGVRAAIDDSV